MKFYKSLALVLPTFASSTLLLGPVNMGKDTVEIGSSHGIVWLQDVDYELFLWLVKKGDTPDVAWGRKKVLFKDVTHKPCNGSYIWHVTDDIEPGQNYGIYISGEPFPLPEPDDHGIIWSRAYADLSPYFDIVKPGSS